VLDQFSLSQHNSLSLLYNGTRYEITSLDSYWYRRGRLIIDASCFKIADQNNLQDYLTKEYSDLITGIHVFFGADTKSISSFLDNDTNKLANLIYAQKAGLITPDTIVTDRKSVLISFFEQCSGGVITKSIYHGGYYEDTYSFYGALTSVVTQEDIDELPEAFNVSLFQKNIDKAFELRIFFLYGKIFASAIFSQNDKMTETDFRNYNPERPNRVVSFELTDEIRNRLIIFMQSINMNSGSIDMIYSKSGEYIFLEVNPIGQFKQVSLPCNYYLELEIAKQLSYG